MAAESIRCANADCNFEADGRCVEGFALDECPHVSALDIETIEEAGETDVRREEVKTLPLSLGEALARCDASTLQRQRSSCAIGIVAPNEAGKTSLIASVYDLLQGGAIDGIGFAGSSTLIGFEKVCHSARTSSRRDMPHMERTSAGADATFFHLDLLSTQGELVSLFIADRSGEDYLAVADDLGRSASLFELRRADTLTMLVNGEHLVSSAYRHETKAITSQIVGALVEAGAVRRGCRLAVVLTKQDVVLNSPNAGRVGADFGEVVDGIVEDHGAYFGEIERFVIAASPRNIADVQRGHGMDKLLHFWLCAGLSPLPATQVRNSSTRLMDLLEIEEQNQ
ncbi:TRAFAC clade GTPase domain-containing protein [Stenotrophomonas sp. CFBP8980]|uniref:TRAFAC clade GTPase domain-containing protein n=1 Tax=Stenotrophomonas sp. CFBP8980 TaxID=3096523 RepID=UPI002A6B0468|nr:hypothetical protein [Stenotrophomonas sp. CFBP8980]MDY1032143.1 hypothetical protein [Stenotrophomonas sp. CFBP8980]